MYCFLIWALPERESFTEIELSIWNTFQSETICADLPLFHGQLSGVPIHLFVQNRQHIERRFCMEDKKTEKPQRPQTWPPLVVGPPRELLVCWVLQQTLLVVRQSDGLRCGTPPGHTRAHQGIQGTPGQGSHYFDCPSSRVRRGQLPCWAVNSEGPPWLDCPSN